MAKNLGRKYATMSEDERRRFELEEPEGTSDQPAELEFDEPRDEDHMGRHYATAREETADPERRDGAGAPVDEEQHQGAVRDAATRGKGAEPREATKSRIDDV